MVSIAEHFKAVYFISKSQLLPTRQRTILQSVQCLEVSISAKEANL